MNSSPLAPASGGWEDGEEEEDEGCAVQAAPAGGARGWTSTSFGIPKPLVYLVKEQLDSIPDVSCATPHKPACCNDEGGRASARLLFGRSKLPRFGLVSFTFLPRSWSWFGSGVPGPGSLLEAGCGSRLWTSLPLTKFGRRCSRFSAAPLFQFAGLCPQRGGARNRELNKMRARAGTVV